MTCPACRGTGKYTSPSGKRLDIDCPLCQGTGRSGWDTQRRLDNVPSSANFSIFFVTMLVVWTLGGILAATALCYGPGGLPALLAPGHFEVMRKLVAVWAAFGGVMGIAALLNYVGLIQQHGPQRAFSFHLVHMSALALSFGVGISIVQYRLVDPAMSTLVRNAAWAVPINIVAALVFTHFGIWIITKMRRQFS